MIIDAFNVIHSVGDLRRALYKSLHSARDQLAERVASIHDVEGIHIILVFDGRNESLEVEHPFDKKTFEYVYSPSGLSADGVIERLLVSVPDYARTTVASNDAAVRESARANGAIAITAGDLYDWICACERRLMRDVEHNRKLNNSEWRNGIDVDLLSKAYR